MVKICTPPNVVLSLFLSALLFSSLPPRQTHAREKKKKLPGLSLVANMPSMIGIGSRRPPRVPRRKVTSTEFGSPVFAEPPAPVIKHELPLSYPVLRYSNWSRYSAFPPPPKPMRRFKGCNTVIDFRADIENEPIEVIPRCHRLHYVPRVFTWNWTAREHLVGLERLQRFLQQFPTSKLTSDPEVIADYLYAAQLNKIHMGLLKWPKHYWNALYVKECPLHELIAKGMEVKLARRIREERDRVDGGFGDITPEEWFAKPDALPLPESDSESLYGARPGPSRPSGFAHSISPESSPTVRLDDEGDFDVGSDSDGSEPEPDSPTPPRASSGTPSEPSERKWRAKSLTEVELDSGCSYDAGPLRSRPRKSGYDMLVGLSSLKLNSDTSSESRSDTSTPLSSTPMPDYGDCIGEWSESEFPRDAKPLAVPVYVYKPKPIPELPPPVIKKFDFWSEFPEPVPTNDDIFGVWPASEPPKSDPTERDILDELEWLEFLMINRRKEGLGWSEPVVIFLVGKCVR